MDTVLNFLVSFLFQDKKEKTMLIKKQILNCGNALGNGYSSVKFSHIVILLLLKALSRFAALQIVRSFQDKKEYKSFTICKLK